MKIELIANNQKAVFLNAVAMETPDTPIKHWGKF